MGEEQGGGGGWTGISASSGCGGTLFIGLILIAVVACMVGLVAFYGMDAQRTERASARASEANAQAAARAAEARAEVDKRQVEANRDVALQGQQLNFQLERAWQSQEAFERTYALALLAVSRLDKREMKELDKQLCQAGQCDVSSGGNRAWEIALAIVLALGVFAAFQWLRVYWGLKRRRHRE